MVTLPEKEEEKKGNKVILCSERYGILEVGAFGVKARFRLNEKRDEKTAVLLLYLWRSRESRILGKWITGKPK
jgi:hypothetical protein